MEGTITVNEKTGEITFEFDGKINNDIGELLTDMMYKQLIDKKMKETYPEFDRELIILKPDEAKRLRRVT
jgi:hypothetical protein